MFLCPLIPAAFSITVFRHICKRGNSGFTDEIHFLFFLPHKKVGPKMLDHEGKEVPGNRGYKYFGAAKDLPGVRELFEKEREWLALARLSAGSRCWL